MKAPWLTTQENSDTSTLDLHTAIECVRAHSELQELPAASIKWRGVY